MPPKEADFLFTHPQPNSIVTDAVNLHGKQHHAKPTLYDRDWKRIDLFGGRHTPLQLCRILNYQALMAKYNHMNYGKLNIFIDHMPEAQQEQFKAIIHEGQLVARTVLQTALGTRDKAACSVSTVVVMRRALWLHFSDLLKEVPSQLRTSLSRGPDSLLTRLTHHFTLQRIPEPCYIL